SMLWTADVPVGSSLEMSVRFGDTPVPDGSWSSFIPVNYSGGPAAATSRYAQYRAVLTGAGDVTPVLSDVTITIAPPGPDTAAPSISAISASPGSTTAVITWTTDESATSI